MSAIENYYELLEEIRISNFRVGLYQNEPSDKSELIREIDNNKNLYQHLDEIRAELSKDTDDADSIRMAFVNMTNCILDSLKKIEGWGSYYPDLNQGMSIRGFLFGQILTDFKTALKFEGGHPNIQIHMSTDRWDYEPLKQLIFDVNKELVNSYFTSKIQAINYYEELKTSVLGLIDQLKKQGVI
jgi:hypothetical protein